MADIDSEKFCQNYPAMLCFKHFISGRAGGHCDRMFALSFLLSHWSFLDLGEIPAEKMCMSLPQVWSAPRGGRIEPEPVMKCNFAQSNTDQVSNRKCPPLSCKLYDARSR